MYHVCLSIITIDGYVPLITIWSVKVAAPIIATDEAKLRIKNNKHNACRVCRSSSTDSSRASNGRCCSLSLPPDRYRRRSLRNQTASLSIKLDTSRTVSLFLVGGAYGYHTVQLVRWMVKVAKKDSQRLKMVDAPATSLCSSRNMCLKLCWKL